MPSSCWTQIKTSSGLWLVMMKQTGRLEMSDVFWLFGILGHLVKIGMVAEIR